MKVLITGAGGFLGFALAKLLASRGYQVTNFSRSHHPKLDKIDVPTIAGNLISKQDCERALKGQEAVIHCASLVRMWGKFKDFYQTNTLGTQNLLHAANKQGVGRFIYTSTPSVVYGKHPLRGANESIAYPKQYLSHYAHSKMLAEKIVLGQSSKLLTCSLRPHLIFGHSDPHIIPKLIESRKNNKLKIVGDGKNKVDVIDVDNAALYHLIALEALASKPQVNGQAFFLGQEKPVMLWSFINQILEINGLAPITQKIGLKKAYYLGAFMEKCYKTLGQYQKDPPMTRFVALQLGTDHYFSHAKAKSLLGDNGILKLDQCLEKLRSHSCQTSTGIGL